MTVQDFIVIYNQTFKHIEEKGIKGAYEYWGAGSGTLDREDAAYDINLKKDKLIIEMNKCPSVGELKDRNREIYYDYCEHCAALYDAVLRKYGLTMDVDYKRDEDTDLPVGKCKSEIIELK